MKRRKRVRKTPRLAAVRSGRGKPKMAGSRSKTGKRKRWSLMGSAARPQLHSMKITDFYRPLKKPVTLRLDADVIAWFKKDGRRYQTRINAALRKVMVREMRGSGW